MRSVNRWAATAAVAALAAGCGNYSTEDLRFLAALPQREDLRVAVPATAAPATGALTGLAALSSCAAPGDATIWQDGEAHFGRPQLRRRPGRRAHRQRPQVPAHRPRTRTRAAGAPSTTTTPRTRDPGRDRPHLAGRGRRQAAGTRTASRGAWGDRCLHALIVGNFHGASASRGDGDVTLDFEAFWKVGVANPDTPHGSMTIGYSRSSDPVTTDLNLLAAPEGGLRRRRLRIPLLRLGERRRRLRLPVHQRREGRPRGPDRLRPCGGWPAARHVYALLRRRDRDLRPVLGRERLPRLRVRPRQLQRPHADVAVHGRLARRVRDAAG